MAALGVAILGGTAKAWAEQPVLVIDGLGWGHGVGMSQEGALTMAAAGATTEAILERFYPGTTKGSAESSLAVAVLESAQRVETLRFPGGGEVRAALSGRQPAGFPVVVAAGGSVDVVLQDTGYRVSPRRTYEAAFGTRTARLALISAPGPDPAIIPIAPPPSTTSTRPPDAVGTTTTTPPTPSTTAPATTAATSAPKPVVTPPTSPAVGIVTGPLWAVPRPGATTTVASTGRSYRGVIEVGSERGGSLHLVNHVDVEDYLRGMGEVRDPSWPPAALRAQTIAARTYAVRATAAGAQLCDDDRCQVYLGRSAEYAAMDRAVADTRGQVLRYGGALAATFYSANAGGVTATPEEGFGDGGGVYPYLVAAPYPTADPLPWTERASMAEIGRRLAYPDRLTSVRIGSTGPSKRVTGIVLDGSAGPVTVDGRTFAARLGLHSTLFAVRSEVGDPSPLPEISALPLESQAAIGPPAPRVDVADSPDLAASGHRLAIAPTSAPRVRSRSVAPALLLLLLGDVGLMAVRARRRRRAHGPGTRPPQRFRGVRSLFTRMLGCRLLRRS